MKQRQREDTDGLSCKLHLLTLESLNIIHNSRNTEINAYGEKPCNNQINILKYISVIQMEIFMFFYIYQLNQIIIQHISLSIFACLFIILLQNVNNQINNIQLPEEDTVNTVWSA